MLFSIVTITCDNREGLARTALSLEGQEFRDFEWIIVDGASKDGTEKDFPRYDALIVSEKDEGIYDAMNKGMALAKGDYLLFLNAGDALAQTQTLRKIGEALFLSKPDFIYGDAWEFSRGRTWYKKAKAHVKLGQGMFTHHQAMFYKRTKIGEDRYNPLYKIAADYDFTVRFLSKCDTCLYLSLPVCVFDGGGVSQRRAHLGRREQFAVRQRTKMMSIPKNAAIYAAQMVSWSLRNCAPKLYWKLKKP